jgi:TPP-dependent pyruvate/acetoin dehydrogenase alpha subunit
MTHTAQSLIAFEDRVRESWQSGNLPCLLHLCGGEEQILIDIFADHKPGDWTFGNHRSHYLALLAGMSEQQVWDGIHRGDSMFLYSREHRFYSSAILAGCCAIAVGVAVALKAEGSDNHVRCFIGDGAEESGFYYEAVLYAHGHNLPITFVILDNNRQVDTPKLERRGIKYGLLDAIPCVHRYHYTPTYPHGGSGAAPGSITFKDTTQFWSKNLHGL